MSKARDLAGLFNLGSRSGTTAQRPATADVGDIFYNGTTGKTEIYTITGWKEMASGIPFGNTASRPTAVTGQPYFNGEAARLELYTGNSWENIVQEVPGVSSISGTYSEATDSGVITINGTNFVSGAYATAIGANGVQINAASTVYNSLVQLTATFTGLSNAQEPYDIKVTNPSNLFGLIPDALYINASPVWQTASGSLGTFMEQVSITLSALSGTDSDSTVTYALASGSTLPSGVTLNSSTGVISGTLPDISTQTTYSFTINATDGVNNIPRTFSITSTLDFVTEYLVIAGGGSGASSIGGGGGAGGMREGSLTLSKSSLYNIVVGAGGASPGFTASYDRIGLKGNDSRFASIYSTGGGPGGNHNAASPGTAGQTALRGGSGGGGGRHTPGGGGGAGGPGGNGTGGGPIYQYGGYGNEGGYSSVEGYEGGYGLENHGAGFNCGAGGIGRQSSITGVATYYAGGGGGGGYQSNNGGGAGGLGGGGRGRDGQSGDNATGHGSGGGGAGYPGNVAGGAGSGGLVVLAYPSSRASLTVSGGLTYTLDTTTRAGHNVYKFTAGSGTVTF